MLEPQYVYGVIPYKTKKEKLKAWKQLKQEFGDSVKLIIKDGLISYSYKEVV